MYIKDTMQRFLGDSTEYGRKFDSQLDERNYKLSPANCPVRGSMRAGCAAETTNPSSTAPARIVLAM